MPTFALTYAYVPGSDESRAAHRPAHVEFLEGLRRAGILYMSGPLVGPEPGALLILEDADRETLTARMDDDPFFTEGLIRERAITQWNVFFDPRAAVA